MAKFFPQATIAPGRFVPMCSLTTTSRNRLHGTTSTQARRVHAAGQHSHRRVALSRRLAGRQFQFSPHIRELIRKLEAGKFDAFLHGRSSGGAEHAGQCAQTQPHRHPRSSRSRCCRPGGRDRPYRADRDRLDHLRRALSCRPPLCFAGPTSRAAARAGISSPHQTPTPR